MKMLNKAATASLNILGIMFLALCGYVLYEASQPGFWGWGGI